MRLWDQNGGKQREFEPFGDLALEAVMSHDDSRVFAADWTGEIRVWDAKDGRRLANLAVNPAPVATRIEQVKQTLATARAEADSLAKQLDPLQNAMAPMNAAVTAVQTKLTAAEAATAKQAGLVQQLDQMQRAKAAAVNEASVTLNAADALAAQLAAGQNAAEKAIAQSADAEKSAVGALATAKTTTEKALADKNANDPSLAASVAALKSCDDSRSHGRGCGRAGKAGPEDPFARADACRRRHEAVGGLFGLGPCDGSEERRSADGSRRPHDRQGRNPCVDFRTRPHQPGPSGESGRGQGSHRWPSRPAELEYCARCSEERACPGECRQGRRGESHFGKEGAAGRSTRQGEVASVGARFTGDRAEAPGATAGQGSARVNGQSRCIQMTTGRLGGAPAIRLISDRALPRRRHHTAPLQRQRRRAGTPRGPWPQLPRR